MATSKFATVEYALPSTPLREFNLEVIYLVAVPSLSRDVTTKHIAMSGWLTKSSST